MKDKNHMIISIDAIQHLFIKHFIQHLSLDKIQHPFMIKTQQSGNRGNIPKHNKGHIQQPTASSILTRQKLQGFPLRLGTRQGCLLSPLLLHSTGSPSHCNQIRRNRRHPNWKGRNKTVFICR